VVAQVLGPPGPTATREILGATDDDEAERRRQPHRDHVGGEELAHADAGVEDLATGLLALLALLSVRRRPLFWLFVVAFNVVGTADLLLAYIHAMRIGLPEMAGQLGAAYAIPILYVPLLMITHVAAFTLLLRRAA
jgi:MYXO-CTERM domain-containing protein